MTGVSTERDGFRPDLEGLRAVAVILVLLFHARIPGFGGGYVGVDVFFVLSGFLITGLILREQAATGRVSLPAFYARRARRLLPAAALALAVTLAASVAVLPPLQVVDVARDAAASALYAANIHFALQATDYLQSELAPSPLLHYWSLGVEEQFYLFWPALLAIAAWLGARLARSRPAPSGSTAGVGVAIGVVGIASLALSVWLTGESEPLAFFLLPTRAWELAMGAVLAIVAFRGVRVRAGVAAPAGAAGVGLIIVAGAVLSVDTPFPGTAALLPTVGAALVIAAGLAEPATVISRALTVRPFRFLGRISYSLYLWHWPLLVLPAAALGGELPLAARLGLAVATVPVAAASQRWVEEPFRRGRLVGVRPRVNLALAGGLAVILAAISLTVASPWSVSATTGISALSQAQAERKLAAAIGSPSASAAVPPTNAGHTRPESAGLATPFAPAASVPPPASVAPTPPQTVPEDLQPSIRDARTDLPQIYADGCVVGSHETNPGTCVYGDPAGRTTVVLLGDSHAAQWFPALDRLAASHHWRLVALTKTRCPSVDYPAWSTELKRPYTECDQWNAAAIDRIRSERADVVVISDSIWDVLSVDGQAVPSREAESTWDAALGRRLTALAAFVPRVVLIADTPQAAVDPPTCLSAHQNDVLACATPRSQAISATRITGEQRAAARSGVTFIDPTRWVCPTDPCSPVVGDLLVYHDGGHISATFAAALAPYIAAELGIP